VLGPVEAARPEPAEPSNADSGDAPEAIEAPDIAASERSSNTSASRD
jgi:hypothetical protein